MLEESQSVSSVEGLTSPPLPSHHLGVLVQRLRSMDQGLIKLKLVREPLEFFDDFIEALQYNPIIQYVLLEGSFLKHLSSSDLKRLFDVLATLTNLREIEVWNHTVSLSLLCEGVGQCQQLIKLGLGFVKLQEWEGCQGLNGHCSLETVYLSHFQFVGEDRDETEDDQEFDPSSHLDSFVAALSTCPSLQKVEMCKCIWNRLPFTPHALSSLATSKSLKHLLLQLQYLTTSDLIPFATSLRGSNLQILDLNENRLSDEDCRSVFTSLSKQAHLKTLSLRNNRLTSRGIRIMVEALIEHKSNLTKLSLNANCIRDQGAYEIGRLLTSDSQLKHLELNRCHLTDSGCCHLAETLVLNRDLLSLSLFANQMTDASYEAFGRALQHNESLTFLDLNVPKHQISKRGCDALLKMAENNYTLLQLSTPMNTGSDMRFYALEIAAFLCLNHAGRKRLLQGNATRADWVGLIAKVDNCRALYHLLKMNPSLLFQR